APLQARYEDLLRTTIACGAPGMPDEMDRLLHQLVRSDVTPTRALRMHLAAVESLLAGLHGSTARHVIERADLLALELLARLGERSLARRSPFETGLNLLDSSPARTSPFPTRST